MVLSLGKEGVSGDGVLEVGESVFERAGLRDNGAECVVELRRGRGSRESLGELLPGSGEVAGGG